MISPTTSTNKLTGLDDYFFRVMPPNRAETDHLAHHAYEKMDLRKIAGVYDLSNPAFTEGWYWNVCCLLSRTDNSSRWSNTR